MTIDTTTTCQTCGKPLPPPAPIGRPRTYCGVRCRRAAEGRLRVLRHQLVAAESALACLRRDGSQSIYAIPDGVEAATRQAEARIAGLRALVASVAAPDG